MALHSFLLPPSTSFLRNVAINFIPWNFQFAFPLLSLSLFFDFLFLPRTGPALNFDEIRFVDSITGLTFLRFGRNSRKEEETEDSCPLSWNNVSKLIRKGHEENDITKKRKYRKKIPTI